MDSRALPAPSFSRIYQFGRDRAARFALEIFLGSTDSTQPSARISAARSAMTDAAPVGVRMADGRCGSRGQLVRVTGGN